MNKILIQAMACAICSSFAAADSTYDQSKAFNDGKSYRGANDGIKANINSSALNNVPGQDAETTNQLKNMYGTDIKNAGGNKSLACATYQPGSDAYKNQECDAINYINNNPSQKPNYTIDKTYDPIIVRGNNVTNAPQAYTSGAAGLSGSYTACTDKTTNLPAQYNTERCEIGHEITEGYCPTTLKVTYTWQLFTGQPGADTRYGRCPAGQYRGDQFPNPYVRYETETVSCAAYALGTGSGTLTWAIDCLGNRVLVGYDAGSCENPPNPAAIGGDMTIGVCLSAPRSIENCFEPGGGFTTKTTVPVFKDTMDESLCTELNAHRAVFN